MDSGCISNFQIKFAWQQEEQHHKLCELRCYAVHNTGDEAMLCSCRHHDVNAQGLNTRVNITLPVLAEVETKPTQVEATASLLIIVPCEIKSC